MNLKLFEAIKMKLSVNRNVLRIINKIIEDRDWLKIKVEQTDEGATVIDAGISSKGGFQAGRIITEICMGGLGNARILCKEYGHLELPSIFVYTDHPSIATLGSQFAGWKIKEESFSAIGSGPARALALKPPKIYEEIGYKDTCDRAVLILETEKPPSAESIHRISKECRVKSEKLALILTPTTSLAGAIQISGRVLETGIHKLRKAGLDPKTILYAWGCAPIPPIHPEFAKAMTRTNDAILYGGTSHFIVEFDNLAKLQEIIEKAPSKASKSYGKPFIEIFKEARNDFYKIDPDLFAPAVVTISDVKTGKTLRNGEINAEMLKKSFEICEQ